VKSCSSAFAEDQVASLWFRVCSSQSSVFAREALTSAASTCTTIAYDVFQEILHRIHAQITTSMPLIAWRLEALLIWAMSVSWESQRCNDVLPILAKVVVAVPSNVHSIVSRVWAVCCAPVVSTALNIIIPFNASLQQELITAMFRVSADSVACALVELVTDDDDIVRFRMSVNAIATLVCEEPSVFHRWLGELLVTFLLLDDDKCPSQTRTSMGVSRPSWQLCAVLACYSLVTSSALVWDSSSPDHDSDFMIGDMLLRWSEELQVISGVVNCACRWARNGHTRAHHILQRFMCSNDNAMRLVIDMNLIGPFTHLLVQQLQSQEPSSPSVAMTLESLSLLLRASLQSHTQPDYSLWLVAALLLDTNSSKMFETGLRILQQFAKCHVVVSDSVAKSGDDLPLEQAEFKGIVTSLISGLFITDTMESCALLLPYTCQLPCPIGRVGVTACITATLCGVFLVTNTQLAKFILPMLADALPVEYSCVANALRTQANVTKEYISNVCSAAARMWLPEHAHEFVFVIQRFASSAKYRNIAITCLQAILHEQAAQSCTAVFLPLLTDMIATQRTDELLALLARSYSMCAPYTTTAPVMNIPSAPPSHEQPHTLLLLRAVAEGMEHKSA